MALEREYEGWSIYSATCVLGTSDRSLSGSEAQYGIGRKHSMLGLQTCYGKSHVIGCHASSGFLLEILLKETLHSAEHTIALAEPGHDSCICVTWTAMLDSCEAAGTWPSLLPTAQ